MITVFNPKYPDICSTCDHAPGCTFTNYHDKPMYHCNEYESHTVVKKKPTEKKPAKNSASPNKKKKTEYKYKGLCSDCENIKICTFPKTEGGVWHCEDYL